MTANVNVTKVLFKRGNTAQNAAYTGINGEITVDTQAKTLRIHDGVTAGGNVITGSGGNPFNQTLNSNSAVTFYSLDSTIINVSQINGTNPDDELLIRANNQDWTFGNTGHITFPTGTILGDTFGDGGITLQTAMQHYTALGSFDKNAFMWVADTDYYNDPARANAAVYIATDYLGAGHFWTFAANGSLTVPGNILPRTNVTYSLGDSTHQWKDIWVSNATIYFNSVPLSTDATGNITYNGNPLVSFVDGNFSVGGTVISGGGSNIAGLTSTVGNQAASHGSTVYTLTLNSNNNDNPAIKVYKGTNDENSAISIGQSNSGFRQANVVAIGNDDVGYNALPGGVYIGYQAGWNDTEDAQGLHAIAIGSKAAWQFATNNSITLNATGSQLNPDESGLFIKPIRAEEYDDAILYYNPNSGEVTYATNTGGGALIGNTAPTAVNGRLWYNTEDGRTYVYALDTWIDASPAVVAGNMVGYDQDGNITLNEDARINYANGVSIINSVYGDAEVAEFLSAITGNIGKIGSDPLAITAANIRLTSDNETWTFASDGVVVLPNGMTIESYGTLGVNASIDIGGDDTRIRIDNNGAPPGFSITANATGGMASRTWLFGPDGSISFPDGSTQTTAYTGGGGGSGNALVNGGYTVTLQANGVLTIGANATISNDGEFRLWATDTDITVYRNGQDGYGVKAGNIQTYTDNVLRTVTNSQGFELKTGNITIPNDKGVVFANGVPILDTIVGITSINTSVTTSTINDESGDFSYGSLSYDYAVNGVTSGGFTIDYSAPLVHGNVDVNVGNVIATNISVSGNLTVANTLVNRVYLLEAYASVTYTLPGSFAEDVCRYSVVSNAVNVPSAWFNTSTYTFTPLKAGYWEITAAYDVYRNAEASMVIKKNTSIVASAGSFNAVAQQVTKIVYLNGSTDYVQIYNFGGAALERSQYDGRSWFQARWVGA